LKGGLNLWLSHGTPLQKSSRLLAEASLQPVQGGRFQPTGFPDLGAARYELPDRTEMLLVESAQSMANRLEAICWDEASDELQAPLKGMPYVRVKLWNSQTTNSILEAHRLNSPYIMNDDAFKEELRQKANVPQCTRGRGQSSDSDDEEVGAGLVDRRALARAVFFFDPCSILHGVFLVNLDGRVRLQRCISSFIEAKNVRRADSGGVKMTGYCQEAIPSRATVMCPSTAPSM
jgi:CRISPR-associated protein Csb1